VLQLATVRPAMLVATVFDGNVSVLDSRTGSVSHLTGDGISALPHWTADGGTLFFAKRPYGQAAQVWRWQPGSTAIQIQAGLWAPDGSVVAFSQPVTGSAAGTTAVWVERGGRREQITPTEPGREWEPLAWSPDSRRLALARYTTLGHGVGGRSMLDLPTLWLTDRTLTQRRQLPLPNPNGAMHSWPDTVRWSPNGSWLLLGVGPGQACESCRADGLPFYALPATGGAAVPLESVLPDGAIAWAPDSRWIVCSGEANTGRITYQQKRLSRYAGPSGRRTALTSDLQWSDIAPAVSPDGQRIAFARGHSQRPGETTISAITSRRLWLMPATGGQPRQVTSTAGWTDEAPAWSPDGAWLVFVRWRPKSPAGPAAAGFWAVRPDGSQLQQLVSAIGSSHGANNFANGFGYYGWFGWDQHYAIAPTVG
jgi:Tol biopolymer transport system component